MENCLVFHIKVETQKQAGKDEKVNNEGKNDEVNNSSGNHNDDLKSINNDHYYPEIRVLNIKKDSKNSDGSCGFNLSRSKWDPYPWVSAVDRNFPAYNAGLKVGDCVLEVNGQDILGLRISEIANIVKTKPDNLTLLLWCTGRDPACDENSLCCGPMPLSLERLSASMQTILACLECPVCMDIVPAPVSQCQNGHILCIKCRSKSEKCPICRQHYSCVRSLIAEQIYNSILDAFKLNSNDDQNTDDVHLNNAVRSTGRKLREKLFGAKYKRKQDNQNEKQQQTMQFETTKSLGISTKIKSASTIGINDTTSYDLNLNDHRNTLNKENQHHSHHGSGSIFSNQHGILKPKNKFLAKILGKAYSLENLSSRNSEMDDSNSLGVQNNSNNTVISNNCNHSKQYENNGRFEKEQQISKEYSDNNYLKSLNCNIEEVKQFSQSTNDLSSLSLNKHRQQECFQANNNLTIIAIPRCPSLNPLPTNIKSTTTPTTDIKTTTSNSILSTSMLSRQSGSLKGLNNYNNNNKNSFTNTSYSDDINCIDIDIDNTNNNYGIVMSRKAISNASLSVNNLHFSSCNTGLILHKRPSPSTSTLSVLNVAESTSLLNFPTESVDNVDFTDTVNQSLTLSVPKINEIKRYHNKNVVDVHNDYKIDDDDDDTDCYTDVDNNNSDFGKIKVQKLSEDVRKFLCPYDCCDDKFNSLDLKHHIKKIHGIPIISFGSHTADISLPLREPMNSCIIELELNEKLFWIKIDVDENGSILAIALFHGTEDESLTFMLEGQLRNRVDDKILEKEAITRSMVHSIMKNSWNIQQNNIFRKNFNQQNINSKLLVSSSSLPSSSSSPSNNIETQNIITPLEGNRIVMEQQNCYNDESNVILNDNIVKTTTIRDNINNTVEIDEATGDGDEFNALNCINNETNLKKLNIENYININNNNHSNDNGNNKNNIDNDNDIVDDDEKQQVENVFFHYSNIENNP
ncbi:probable serine/threonine-protein kinase cdc7 [Condylostylus longicornis]|uniref:probable serine/threonine-protein kinase cdc7 n=1 Tax=Condylostylus longicornis TaxID=2530218 RepID=UPI00244DEDD3|nr:probable serine/threonine-protein kinase cdc7 [Condylostylus longicornis]